MPTTSIRERNRRGLRVAGVRQVSEGRAPGIGARARVGVAATTGAAGAAAAADPTRVLLSALAGQELEATHELDLRPDTRTRPRTGVAARAGAAAVDVDVDVEANESAAVLVEHDGEYSWHFPVAAPAAVRAPRAAARRGAARPPAEAAAPGRRTVTISISLAPAPAPRARPGRRGPVRRELGIGGIISAAKGIVLKFVAHTAAGAAMHLLERNVRTGLVVINGPDVTQWSRAERIDDLGLPDRPLRILLWVHGTFSSTIGAFGAITSTSEGRAFLTEAHGHYDAIIGYDHATLSVDPHANAVDLMERLGRFGRAMSIDAIMHSRGGLVYRSLVEQLLPAAASRPTLGPAIFVGVPNEGTLLAEPDNWHTLLDLYTNVAVGAFNLLRLIPAAAPAATVLTEVVSGLGALVKFLADAVISDGLVPGLAAMEPKGAFIHALNETGQGQPLPDGCRYLAVTSNFDPNAAMTTGAKTGLAASFTGRLANGFIDQLFGEPNDLVVNDASMKQIDPEAGDFIDGALDFGDSPVVYHTVYFAQEAVAQNLRTWLLDDTARAGLESRPGVFSVHPSAHSPFMRVRYHRGRVPGHPTAPAPAPLAAATARGARAGRAALAAAAPARAPSAKTLTDAAEGHLASIFGARAPDAPPRPAAPGLRAAAAPPRPRRYAPKLVETGSQVSRLDDKRAVHVLSFAQTHQSIPIFGTRAVVELDDQRGLVSTYAKLARVDGVSPTPTLSAQQALRRLATSLALPRAAQTDVAGRAAPLTFFHDDETKTWHLAYVFSEVPGRPAPTRRGPRADGPRGRDRHGIGPGPRQRFPLLDYLVDAHDGSVVYYYSTTPTATKALPQNVKGVDDEGVRQTLWGRKVGKTMRMEDPQRRIVTMDLGNGSIDSATPAAVTATTFDFAASNTAAVSAHVNATHVFDFYNGVLIRKGVDDNGMTLENIVNCTSPDDEPPPSWGNAVWWRKKMWYGQIVDGRGKRRSLARYLDIIAHELTHGVTETTSNLVYRDEAGALNESFSDIFGVIIANRVRKPAADPRDWDWRIGAGLGEKPNQPLRSMKNPALTGDPAHTDDLYVRKPGEQATYDNDYGYVHTNSNIHNKAAYNLLTATVSGGNRKGGRAPLVFGSDEVAKLYYFTLQRLDRVATFEDVYFTLLDVARTVYPDPADQKPRLDAITAAYAAVGIPRKRTVAAPPPSAAPKRAGRKTARTSARRTTARTRARRKTARTSARRKTARTSARRKTAAKKRTRR